MFIILCKKVYDAFVDEGEFIFSAENPIFTEEGKQDWNYDELGNRLHWSVDNYFNEGKRINNFLGEEVTKYHKTLTTYINILIKNEFEIVEVTEAQPSDELPKENKEMQDELRRLMMILISAKKK